jgi:glutamate synthase (NADPH/NADH) small chain
MGKVTGFLDHARELAPRRPATERVNDWFEIYTDFREPKLREQAARCMDCGVPFCHSGCPVNNLIPDWNDLVYRGKWREAVRQLHATNNFPEFTGRICPAPCEASCVLGINQPAVTIKQLEKSIVERGFAEGWIRPEPPSTLTGKRVAVVGSGPSGLATAQQLRRAGHEIFLYEKADRFGGLLRYGIPHFKLESHILDRRLTQMLEEGVRFEPNVHVGRDVTLAKLRAEFDAVVLAGGSEQPRDIQIPGRELKGIHFAMDFLPQQNRRCLGDELEESAEIIATGKNVVIIGGGDTGADCLGTCHRQKARSVQQFEIMPMPPATRSSHTPWPLWPTQLRVEAAHEEGGKRVWGVATTSFSGDSVGNVSHLNAMLVGPPPRFEPIPGTDFTIPAELVLIAMGFSGPVRSGMIEDTGIALDIRSNIATDHNHMSSVPGIFAAGDMRRGQSLVVWAIAEGRQTAAAVHRYLS